MQNDLKTKEWDVIVVGTGMGGGTIGRKLAENGLSVLFVEKGPIGYSTEGSGAINQTVSDPQGRLIRGFWPEAVKADMDGEESDIYAPLGAGLGGSSVFYASALERFARHDIDEVADLKHPTGGWPVSYDDYVPYFEEAEKLYHVCGTPDPLNPDDNQTLAKPPAYSDLDAHMVERMEKVGFMPYRLHTGIKYIAGCHECVGFKCPKLCKMDGRSAGVYPALETGNAAIIDKCTVQKLIVEQGRVQGVSVLHENESFTLKAKQVVLAAGGYSSANILKVSANKDHADGLGNDNDLLGRNLMFHLTERMAIWPGFKGEFTGPYKSIASRKLYRVGQDRFGLFHSMGITVSYGMIVSFLNQYYDHSFLKKNKFFREFTRFPAAFATKLFGNAQLYSTLIEDMPMLENRLIFNPEKPDEIRFKYVVSNELISRRKRLQKHLKKALGNFRMMFIGSKHVLEIGHPCGTARFGNDPKTSVLDPSCRVHGVENLYVADSSFMPTSGGVNPSLMIAANALRVGDIIVKQQAK